LAGSLLVPIIVDRLGHTRTVVIGMFGAAIGIGLLPFAHNLTGPKDPSNLLAHPFFLLALVGLMILAGAGIDCIVVPAQTRMQERSPDALRGRVLAFYQVLFNGGAIPVILFMGALTDLLGIQTVILVLAALNVLAGLLTALRAVIRDRNDRSRGNPEDKRTATGSLLTSGKQQTSDQRSLAGDRA
jgi:MFS family permease